MTRLSIALALCLPLLLAACKDAQKSADTPADRDPDVVTLDADASAQIKVAPVTTAPVSETLRVAGRVDFDETRVNRIGATITGRVMELRASPGQTVKSGDTLAVIHSTELSNAQLGYIKAAAQASLQKRNAERARLLFESDVISKAELQRRESEYAIADAEQRAAADQLRVLGVPSAAIRRLQADGAINSVTPVVSTLTGTVVERRVTQGQVVQPSDALFLVADLSRVWLVGEVPENQAAGVLAGQSADIDVPSLATRLKGRIEFISDILNPETRTVTVRVALDNPDRLLKPAMLATMRIRTSPADKLVVPERAVVREADADHVFVETEPDRFRLTPVKLGIANEGLRPVLSGVRDGQRIVVDGAFHLNNLRKAGENAQ